MKTMNISPKIPISVFKIKYNFHYCNGEKTIPYYLNCKVLNALLFIYADLKNIIDNRKNSSKYIYIYASYI